MAWNIFNSDVDFPMWTHENSEKPSAVAKGSYISVLEAE